MRHARPRVTCDTPALGQQKALRGSANKQTGGKQIANNPEKNLLAPHLSSLVFFGDGWPLPGASRGECLKLLEHLTRNASDNLLECWSDLRPLTTVSFAFFLLEHPGASEQYPASQRFRSCTHVAGQVQSLQSRGATRLRTKFGASRLHSSRARSCCHTSARL